MPRVLTEAHKLAMQEGRRRAAAKKAEGAEERVRAFERWSREDAAYHAKKRAGLPTGPKPARVPDELWPSQADFYIVYGEDY